MAKAANDPDPRLPAERAASLSGKRRATFEALFEKPTRSDIEWREIKSLLKALGGEITQGRGSRVRVALGGRKAVFHEPHPEPVTDKGAVNSVRDFLKEAGISG